MASLPNLSSLRPAPAHTGPYVNVLDDGNSCSLSLKVFNPGHFMRLRSSSTYQSQPCAKAWQPQVVDKNGEHVLEPHYYDTIQLALWILDNDTSPLTRRPFVPADRDACIEKALELLRAEQHWESSLREYKNRTYPPAVPLPVEGMDTQVLKDEFMSYGKQTLKLLMNAGSPLHYDQIRNTVSLDGSIKRAETAAWISHLRVHFPDQSFMWKLMAVLWSSYNDLSIALDIYTWATYFNGVNGNSQYDWWRYWAQDVSVHHEVHVRRSMNVSHQYPQTPRTFGDLRLRIQETIQSLQTGGPMATTDALSRTMTWHSDEGLTVMAENGWTPARLVARSALTLQNLCYFAAWHEGADVAAEPDGAALWLFTDLPDFYANAVRSLRTMRIGVGD